MGKIIPMYLSKKIDPRFYKVYFQVLNLKKDGRYLGAFIFGSVARGDATAESDFDVKVIVDVDNSCNKINHPHIDGVKIDLTFQSFKQLQDFTNNEIKKRERVPMIAESIIVFDKTGDLANLKRLAKKTKPKKAQRKDYQLIQFLVYHVLNKAERNLIKDPHTALLVMSIDLNELLKMYYWIKGRWWVSTKRRLRDLRNFDPALTHLVENLLDSSNATDKFNYLLKVSDYILDLIGGRQPITENNCRCKVCKADLNNLLTT